MRPKSKSESWNLQMRLSAKMNTWWVICAYDKNESGMCNMRPKQKHENSSKALKLKVQPMLCALEKVEVNPLKCA